MIPDPLVAVIAHLQADTDVAALVGARVFGESLPVSEDQYMPRKSLVLRASGSQMPYDNLPLGRTRYDVRCYGETPYESVKLYRTVYASLKFDLSRRAYGNTLLQSALMQNGPMQLREPNLDWPFVFTSWLVIASEIAIA